MHPRLRRFRKKREPTVVAEVLPHFRLVTWTRSVTPGFVVEMRAGTEWLPLGKVHYDEDEGRAAMLKAFESFRPL